MGGALGGMIGGMIGGALQRKIGSRKQQSVTMDELLKEDEKNYAIAYDELDAITFNRSKIGRPVKIVVCSNTGKKLVELELNHNAGEQIFGVFSKISALNGKIIQQTH
mgnify:CR=1 FL=1